MFIDRRFCMTELKKQVFPRLTKPLATWLLLPSKPIVTVPSALSSLIILPLPNQRSSTSVDVSLDDCALIIFTTSNTASFFSPFSSVFSTGIRVLHGKHHRSWGFSHLKTKGWRFCLEWWTAWLWEVVGKPTPPHAKCPHSKQTQMAFDSDFESTEPLPFFLTCLPFPLCPFLSPTASRQSSHLKGPEELIFSDNLFASKPLSKWEHNFLSFTTVTPSTSSTLRFVCSGTLLGEWPATRFSFCCGRIFFLLALFPIGP